MLHNGHTMCKFNIVFSFVKLVRLINIEIKLFTVT